MNQHNRTAAAQRYVRDKQDESGTLADNVYQRIGWLLGQINSNDKEVNDQLQAINQEVQQLHRVNFTLVNGILNAIRDRDTAFYEIEALKRVSWQDAKTMVAQAISLTLDDLTVDDAHRILDELVGNSDGLSRFTRADIDRAFQQAAEELLEDEWYRNIDNDLGGA